MFVLATGLEISLVVFMVMIHIIGLIVGICDLADLTYLEPVKTLGIGVQGYDS